jgi:hypothetical protein
VQRVPERSQRHFLHGFAERRMCVDRAGDVFEPCAISIDCENAVLSSETLPPTARASCG